ncbi:MAG: hypothetical protein M1361_01165 [Patescibacteria group bacterium]|nr:hypothetical protein [Patescibacteria group bacterium]MCL5224213.1 hypothetical protein [Patescibacteria group bacterium]
MRQIKSALGEVLKLLNKSYKDQEIRVCDNCGVPLIWTFCWAYRERYCLNCGISGAMLGTGEDVELTSELKYEARVIDDIWKAIYKNLVPRSSYKRNGCKKCEGEDHNKHLSRSEIFRDKTATEILKKLAEGFTVKREILERGLYQGQV